MSVTEYAGVGIECNPPEHYPGLTQYLVFMRNHFFIVFTMQDSCNGIYLSFRIIYKEIVRRIKVGAILFQHYPIHGTKMM